MLVDSHCHIDFEDYAGRIPQILEAMERNQVTHALCVCVNLADFPRVLALALEMGDTDDLSEDRSVQKVRLEV